jgi:DNA polymerase III epsilon subunit-like protein
VLSRSLLSSIAHRNMVFLDTETTGSGPEDAVIEIGAVGAGGDVLVDTLLHPLAPITDGARRVHGISDEDLKDAPSFESIAGRLEDLFTEAGRVWAFAGSYDRRMLAQPAILASQPQLCQAVQNGRWKDLQPVATGILGRDEPVSLVGAARDLGVAFPEDGAHHRALFDARLARRVWTAIERGA